MLKQNAAFSIYVKMLQFKQSDTSAALILTLTENVSISTPYYLFVFTHVTTKDVVKFIKAEIDDESDYPARYNQFTINPSVVFANQQPGEWHYEIHEQTSSLNTDPDQSGAILEYGKLNLDRATDFAYTQYEHSTTFKMYNG